MNQNRSTIVCNRFEEFKRLSLQNDATSSVPQESNVAILQVEETHEQEAVSRSLSVDHNDKFLTSSFSKSVEYVRELIRNINKNITDIESIHTSILSSMTYHYSAEINQKLKQRVQHTSHLNKKVRECLKALEMEQTNTHDSQAQLQALKDSFIQSIQRYQDITRKFQNRQKKQLEIQFLIMKPDATIYEVEQAILSDAVPGLFSRSLLNRSKDANKVLEQVYMRHQDIKRIENTIQELYHLFLDMQTMAQTQQPSSLHSEKALEEPSNDLEKGDKHIYVAVQSKETYRKKIAYLLCISTILLFLVGLLIWWWCSLIVNTNNN